MVRLIRNSLDWAREHLKRQGDTDLFPRPFEIDAIETSWGMVSDALLGQDIEDYEWTGGRRVVVPKARYAFRTATQLDPIDTLVLSALVHQYGSQIENARIPAGHEVVFSHRFAPDVDGSLYDKAINWNTFWGRSVEKARAVPSGFVLMTDISDYYNQIYHHTLENEMLRAELPSEIVRLVSRLLTNLTQGVSRGIPVGPHAIHPLAEIAFDPIDRSLLSRGYEYCRFVDDLHIFCPGEEQADIALYELAQILDRQQRLVLQRHKTQIRPATEFTELARQKVMDAPINKSEREILRIVKRHSGGDPYRTIRLSGLSDSEVALVSRGTLESLLESYLSQSEPNFPRVRWLLRRLTQVGAPGAIYFLIAHIGELTPALQDIGTYIASAENTFEGNWRDIGENLTCCLEVPIIGRSEYLQMTVINLFSRIFDLDCVDYLLQRYDNSSPMVRRKIVKAATKAGKHYWLRERKEEFATADPWLGRAMILGASTFASDERRHWLRRIERVGSLLEKVVAEWVRSGGTI